MRSFSRHSSSDATGSSKTELAELHGQVAGVVLDRRDVVDRLAQPTALGIDQPVERLPLDVDQVRDVENLVEAREGAARPRGVTEATTATPRGSKAGKAARGALAGRRDATGQDSTGARRPPSGAVDAHGPRPGDRVCGAVSRDGGRLRLSVDGGSVAVLARARHPARSPRGLRSLNMSAAPDERGAERRAPRRGPDLLRTVATGTAGRTGAAFFPALVRQLAEAFGAEIAFVTELVDPEAGHAVVLASWQGRRAAGGEQPQDAGHAAGGARARRGPDLDPGGGGGPVPAGPADRAPRARRRPRGRPARRGRRGPRAHRRPGEPAPGGRRGRARRAERSSPRAPPERSSVAGRRPRCATASTRPPPPARASSRRATRSAAASGATCTTGPSSGSSRSDTGSRWPSGALPRTPSRPPALVAKAREQARLANEELRELARGLHPAGLVEYGLGHALAALAASSPLPLRVGALPDRRLPEAVETTVFYLASEGLANAMKYAGATEVRVEVRQDGRRLAVEVADDGSGGADAARRLRPGRAGRSRGGTRGTLEVDSPAGHGTRADRRDPARGPPQPARAVPRVRLRGRRRARRTPRRARARGAQDGEHVAGPRVGARGWPAADRPAARRPRRVGTPPRDRRGHAGHGRPLLDHRRRGRGRRARRRESAEDWRDAQRAFYEGAREELALLLGEPGWHITDDEPMIVTWFELVHDEG